MTLGRFLFDVVFWGAFHRIGIPKYGVAANDVMGQIGSLLHSRNNSELPAIEGAIPQKNPCTVLKWQQRSNKRLK